MRLKPDGIVFGVAAVASIVIPILHLLHALESVNFLEENIPVFTLLMTGLIASYLVTEPRNKLEELDRRMRRSRDEVIRACGGVSMHVFQSSREVYDYVAKRMQTAETSVDDLTWGPVRTSNSPLWLRRATTISEISAKQPERSMARPTGKSCLFHRRIA